MMSTSSESRVILGTVLRGAGATYHIQEVIGEGGQGWVFKASYDDVEGFPVVVKVLRPDSLAAKDALSRFRREAEILKKLSNNNPSPYIVRFFDHGEALFPLPDSANPGDKANLPFTVLEYVHGETLHADLDRHRGQGLPMRRARRLLREVAKALEIVHAQGVVHRDLKPSNILLASEAGREVAKVTDFGLVKVIDLRATATQSLAGVSLSYAPPEQYEPGNPRVGPHTDVFSFATIVFEVLCGTEAFPMNRANPFEALRLIATSKRPKLSERPSTLPLGLRDRNDLIKRLDAELERALDPEPQGRPQTLTAFWAAIDPILREADGKLEAEPSTANASLGTRPGHADEVVQLTKASADVSGYRPPRLVVQPDPSHAATMAQPSRDPFEPSAWTWRILAPGTPGAVVRDASFDDDGATIVTLGSGGLVRWSQGGWTSLPLAIGMSGRELRCVSRLVPGALVLGGEQGLLAFLHGGSMWDVRRFPDPDVIFHAVAADEGGRCVFAVGERASRGVGIVVELSAQGFRRTFDLYDLGPLRAVAFMDSSNVFACGDGGALVRIDDQGLTRIGWERTGHLRSIAATRTPVARAYAVGTGGHALGVATDSGARTTIEKVMTTQDLLGVAFGEDGIPTAVSANARVMRRDVSGVWRRITGDLPIAGNLVRVHSGRGRTLVVAEDASILEGTLVG